MCALALVSQGDPDRPLSSSSFSAFKGLKKIAKLPSFDGGLMGKFFCVVA